INYVGLLEPAKGIRTLLHAYEKVQYERNIELRIWGGTGSRSMSRLLHGYQARLPGILVRPGSIIQHGLKEVYGNASLQVHPSLSDGFGYVVQEAMAAGLPVIVTDTTGAADIVEHGRSGFIVPPEESSAIAQRISYLYDNRSQLPVLGANARSAAALCTPDSFSASLAPLTSFS
ncbi:MAG: glycosyltransferase family 4 protein, partial [Opitutae bacterium]